MTLKEFFAEHKKAALAFSGGTDSSFLLYSGVKYGCDIQPYFVKSPFQPQFELDDAKRLCDELGVKLRIIELDVFSNPEIVRNGADRCYHCKHEIFSNLIAAAKADGYNLILDGTNASDNSGDRPGMKALSELKVLSPLRDCGLSKDDIRRLSKENGIFTWNKPAYACLATRIPTDTPLSVSAVSAVEEAEGKLFNMGFSDFRVRVMGDTAKLQVPENQMLMAIKKRSDIISALSGYFKNIVLDMRSR